jgi:anti-sigma-K factor RskA
MNGPDDVPELTCDEVREMAGSFVLGALSPADDAAVRAHLASCDDAHAEIDELGGVLPALAASVPVVEPPEALKARIMAAAAADLDARRAGAGDAATAATAGTPATAAQAPTAAPAPTKVPTTTAAPAPTAPSTSTSAPAPTPFPTADERAARRPRPSTGTWLLRIAAVLVIAVLGGWNVLLQGQLGTAKNYQQSVAAVLDLAAQPGSLTAVLTADGGTGNGLAAISSRGEFAMAMVGLASTSGDAVYEAWLIGSDRVPKPIGNFTVGNAGTAQLNIMVLPPAPGAIVALTLEPTSNPTTPTLPIISKGVATTAG